MKVGKFDFANAVKTYLGTGFFASEREKVARSRVRASRSYEGVSPEIKRDVSKLVFRRFQALVRKYGDNVGEDFSQEELEILYKTGILLRQYLIDGSDFDGLNNVLFVEEAKKRGQDLGVAMQEGFARNMRNSLLPWVRFFSGLCKETKSEEILGIYFIIIRIIFKQNYNWGAREKNARAEFPVFHPTITPRAVEELKEIIILRNSAPAEVVRETVRKRYGTTIFNFLLNNDLSTILHRLHYIFFWQGQNVEQEVGDVLWLEYPKKQNEFEVRIKDVPDMGILCSPINGLCLGGGAVGYSEYLSRGRVYIMGEVIAVVGFDGRPVKAVLPKVVCFTDNEGEVLEFRGTGVQQELQADSVVKMHQVKFPTEKIDKYVKGLGSTLEFSFQLEDILRKGREWEKKKGNTGRMPLTETEDKFLRGINDGTATIGTRTAKFYKDYFLGERPS